MHMCMHVVGMEGQTLSIKKLDETVVNRIAAGEVIQRPANALKEMIENSLDAKSTSITVIVKQGGLKLLQIQDNGCGIKKEDMKIVCERFTTSKLQKFEDLQSISTYGFRGEALASISHVAHVTLVTRTSDSKCAFKGSYCDGKLKGHLKPCAGNVGTQITVEDLFYNVATRRKVMKTAQEEYSKISEVVTRYAIQNASVGFTLKKHGDSTSDFHTPENSSTLDNIRTVFGPTLAKEVLSISGNDVKLGVEFQGFISNANYSSKKLISLLFINHRLVDSTSVKKAVELVYSAYLPKHTHPFIYLSLEIAPQNIDVNVHPTKHEVHFLHEDLIVECLQKAIEAKLLGCNSSRTFYTQSLLPNVSCDVSKILSAEKGDAKMTSGKVTANKLVRTDNRDRKMDAFFGENNNSCVDKQPQTGNEDIDTQVSEEAVTTRPMSDSQGHEHPFPGVNLPSGPQRQPIRLTSVLNLQADIESETSAGLHEMIRSHTFVGCVEPEMALIQHSTKMYLVNTRLLSEALFYQVMMFEFGNYGVLRLSEPASIQQLVTIALESPASGWTEEDGPKSDLARYVTDLLMSKTEMLYEYFSMKIDGAGNLCTLPLLLDKYLPDMTELPMYILRLATEVGWEDERQCFHTFAKETASFYSMKNDTYLGSNCDSSNTWKWTTEHVLYPAFRATLMPTINMSQNAGILQVADLTELYKVFERC